MNVLRMFTIVFLVVLFILPGHAQSQSADFSKIILTNCNVIDCTGSAPMENMTVEITGNTITSISEGRYQGSSRDGVEVYDLDGAYVLPGFWNMHMHLSTLLPRNHNLDNERFASKVIRAGVNAMDGLRYGFTAVRSVGEEGFMDVAWRDAFDMGFLLGPRIFASGENVSVTAAHRGDYATGADGVAEIRKAVRSRVQNGVNVIKTTNYEMLPDELEAVIETTHSFGIHITAHSREPAVYAAVKAGIDCIEHGYGLTDETIELMAEMGTFYDPTIICNLSDEYIKEREDRLAKLGYSDDEEIVQLRKEIAYADERSPEHALHQRQALKKAADAGVKLLIGSDSAPVGEIGILEMEQFVLSGVSEMETLIAATRNGAEMVGMLDKLGTVEVGKWADLVVVADNPLDNISNIRKVKMVFKDGYQVDLEHDLGPTSYWKYFTRSPMRKGFLGVAENEAGFRRGLADPDKDNN